MSDQRSELEKQTGFEGKGDLYVYLLFAAIIAAVVSIVLFVLCLRRMKALYSGTLFPGRFMKKDVVSEGAEKGQTCRTVEFPAPFSLHKMKRRMEGGRVVNEEFTLYCSPCTCCTGDTVIEFQDHLELLSRPACIAGLLHLLWFIGFGGISLLFFVVSTLPGKEAAGAIFAAACLVGAVPWWAFRCCPTPKWPENLVDEKSTSRPTSGSLLGNTVADSTSSAPVSPAKHEPPKEEKSWPACGRCGKPASLVWGCECTEVLYCSRECKTEHASVHANECKSQGGKGVKGGLAMQSITVSVDQLPQGPVAHQDSLGMAPAPYIGVGSADSVRPSVAVRF